MAQSLYRSYRPQTFADVVGQEHIVSTFEHALKTDNLSHAYLFTGPRGTGKTSMARLLAKALLCTANKDERPDGSCEVCQSIAEGNHPDVYELDAASRTGVDNVRDEIINKVNFSPTQGAYKLYIIDEVHMLSNQAFNALLKTLEEPPSHVVFVLCTTDPQKVPDTILSRCQRFDFKPIASADIAKNLAKVAKSEGIEYEPEALDIIAEQAHGGMRDALSSFEQIAVFSAGKVSLESARSILGQTDRRTLYDFSRALAGRNSVQIFEQIDALNKAGVNYQRFVEDEAQYLRDIYVYSLAGDKALGDSVSKEELERFDELSKSFSGSQAIIRSLKEFGELIREMRLSTHPRLSLEIVATRLANPEQDGSIEALAERIEKLEQGFVPQTNNKPAIKPAVQVESAPQKAEVAKAKPATKLQEKSAPEIIAQGSRQGAQELKDFDEAHLQRAWDEARAHISAKSQAKGVLLNNTHVSVSEEGVLDIEFPQGSEFTLSLLKRDDVSEMLKESIDEAFGFVPPFSFCMGHACALEPEPKPAPAPEPVKDTEPEAEKVDEPETQIINTPEAPEVFDGDLPDHVADMLTEGFGKGWKIIE